jgi:hypothetical protein
MKLLRLKACFFLCALLIVTSLCLSGCLEFKSIEQPSSVLPGELFTVLVEATLEERDHRYIGVTPIFGICLPVGWTIPGDTIAYTGVSQGSITYDPNILPRRGISPAPEGYYWWVGEGPTVWPSEYVPGTVFAEVSVQANLEACRYSLSYLLDSDPDVRVNPSRNYVERSDRHIIEVVDEWTPREMKALPLGSSVVLTWRPPLEKEGLTGYRVYRDGELLSTVPAETTEILDEDLAVDAVYHYSASAVYSDATEHLSPYEIEARIFSGGTGEPNDPYQIALADQLFHLADHRHLWEKVYRLVNDIDLHPDQTSRAPFDEAVIHHFAGIFDGNDHAISNLMISGGSHLGLFGHVESSSQVFDLSIVAVNVIGSDDLVGGLVGYNDGSIGGCYATGIVNGEASTGGLVGRNRGSIVSSHSAVTVRAVSYVGGLVGENSGSITTSYSTGAVNASGADYGARGVGGLAGTNDPNGQIVNCYSSVSGARGGLVGQNLGSIATSYSSGRGGSLVRDGYFGTVEASFWDIQSSGQTLTGAAGGTGLTTSEMQTAGTYLSAGWDFIGETANGTDDIWWIDEGQDYPRLWWEIDDDSSP